MPIGISYEICPECEGVGKAVNYFDPINRNQDKFKVISTKKKRSDGREYYDFACQVCNGVGKTWQASRTSK